MLWYAREDLNLRPLGPQPNTLSPELRAPMGLVPKVRFELTRPYGHYALNVARLPFRHFGPDSHYRRVAFSVQPRGGLDWWAVLDSNQ